MADGKRPGRDVQEELCSSAWLSTNHVVSLPCFLHGKRKMVGVPISSWLGRGWGVWKEMEKEEFWVKERQQEGG